MEAFRKSSLWAVCLAIASALGLSACTAPQGYVGSNYTTAPVDASAQPIPSETRELTKPAQAGDMASDVEGQLIREPMQIFKINKPPSIVIPEVLSYLLDKSRPLDELTKYIQNMSEGHGTEVFTGVGWQSYVCSSSVNDIPNYLWEKHCLRGRRYTIINISGDPINADRTYLEGSVSEVNSMRYYQSSLEGVLLDTDFIVEDWTENYANYYRRNHFPYQYRVNAAYTDKVLIIFKSSRFTRPENSLVCCFEIYLFDKG